MATNVFTGPAPSAATFIELALIQNNLQLLKWQQRRNPEGVVIELEQDDHMDTNHWDLSSD